MTNTTRRTSRPDTSQTDTGLPLWLTSAEICEHFNVGRTTIWRWVNQGRLTAYSVPGTRAVRFRRDDVLGLFQRVA
ncbi:MAG: helix-turn-helix domain-containing protein [Propionibacteriaceae bacterium]|nr:helix-turn-helix domain-containing protein [Propionibacteriaceae bacterium]